MITNNRYMEMDSTLYEKCSRENNDKMRKLEAEREASDAMWAAITEQARAAGIDVDGLIA